MSRRLSLYLKSVKAIWNARHCDKRLVIWVRNIHLSRMLNSKSISMLHLLLFFCFVFFVCLFRLLFTLFVAGNPYPASRSHLCGCAPHTFILSRDDYWWLIHLQHFQPRLVALPIYGTSYSWYTVDDWSIYDTSSYPVVHWMTFHLLHILRGVHCGWFFSIYCTSYARYTEDDVPSMAHLTRGTLWMTVPAMAHFTRGTPWVAVPSVAGMAYFTLGTLWMILFHLWHIVPGVHCGWFFSIYGTSYPGYIVDDCSIYGTSHPVTPQVTVSYTPHLP